MISICGSANRVAYLLRLNNTMQGRIQLAEYFSHALDDTPRALHHARKTLAVTHEGLQHRPAREVSAASEVSTVLGLDSVAWTPMRGPRAGISA